MKIAYPMVMAAALGALSAPAAAADFSFTGTLSEPSDIALFTFDVGSGSTVTLRTYSYAGGTNAAGTTIASGGFDPILALFDSTGLKIGENDDGGSAFVGADPSTGNYYDTYFSAFLTPGTYTVSVGVFPNFSSGPFLSDGFDGASDFNGRSNAYAFDVLNAASASGPGGVPEPGTWAMLTLGFGVVGGAVRRRKQAARVSFA